MNPPKRPLSDGLLRLSVETKIEEGVSPVKILELIEAFASYDQEPSGATEIVGFLEVGDVPQDRRATFLKALLALAEEPDHRSPDLRQKTVAHTCRDMRFPALLVGKAAAFLWPGVTYSK